MQDYLEKIDLRKVVRYTLFMFLTLMAQNMVFSHIRLFGVKPMLLPSAAAAVGMFEGATWGPLFSLVMGYFADMSFVEHRVYAGLPAPRGAGLPAARAVEPGMTARMPPPAAHAAPGGVQRWKGISLTDAPSVCASREIGAAGSPGGGSLKGKESL